MTPRSKTGLPNVGDSVQASTALPIIGADGNAPTADPVAIIGTPSVGEVLDITYDFEDLDPADVEEGTTFQWFRANDGAGTGKISIATTRTYTVVTADQGKFLIAEVTPRSKTGNPKVGPTASATIQVLAHAPTAEDVAVSGQAKVGSTLNGSYRFEDLDNGDIESGTTVQWYRANDASGTGKAAIPGANGPSYTLTRHDEAKFVFFGVIPRSATGAPNLATSYSRDLVGDRRTGRLCALSFYSVEHGIGWGR